MDKNDIKVEQKQITSMLHHRAMTVKLGKLKKVQSIWQNAVEGQIHQQL